MLKNLLSLLKAPATKLLTSAKFWTTVIGAIATTAVALVAKYGFEVDDDGVRQAAATVAGLFGVLLLGQGAADHGKEAAKIKSGQGGFGSIGALLMIVLIGCLVLIAAAQTGCSTLSSAGKTAGQDLYDCGKPEPKKLIEQFGPSMVATVKSAIDSRGLPDLDTLRPVAAALETDAARCVLATAVDVVGKAFAPKPGAPQSEAMPVDRMALNAGFDKLRVEVWGGKTTYVVNGAP